MQTNTQLRASAFQSRFIGGCGKNSENPDSLLCLKSFATIRASQLLAKVKSEVDALPGNQNYFRAMIDVQVGLDCLLDTLKEKYKSRPAKNETAEQKKEREESDLSSHLRTILAHASYAARAMPKAVYSTSADVSAKTGALRKRLDRLSNDISKLFNDLSLKVMSLKDPAISTEAAASIAKEANDARYQSLGLR